jgi:hypothetical protein
MKSWCVDWDSTLHVQWGIIYSMIKDNLDRFFSQLEWRWSLANLLWGVGVLASATLPAWAVGSMNIFSAYAPLSWVLAGMIGFLLFCLGFTLYAVAKHKVVRSRYDAKALEAGGGANPLERTFQKKRIFLNQFCMPSNPYVHDKTFIDCEIIGPANIYLAGNNNISDVLLPKCDAVVLSQPVMPLNAYGFTSCTFQRCSFQRVTFLVSRKEYDMSKGQWWLNWIAESCEPTLPKANPDTIKLPLVEDA